MRFENVVAFRRSAKRAHPDLNQGPADLQSAALTTELCAQIPSSSTSYSKFYLFFADINISFQKPPVGFEPTTSRLLSGCSPERHIQVSHHTMMHPSAPPRTFPTIFLLYGGAGAQPPAKRQQGTSQAQAPHSGQMPTGFCGILKRDCRPPHHHAPRRATSHPHYEEEEEDFLFLRLPLPLLPA